MTSTNLSQDNQESVEVLVEASLGEEYCPECGAGPYARQSGTCRVCFNCGYSKCG